MHNKINLYKKLWKTHVSRETLPYLSKNIINYKRMSLKM